MRRHFHNLLLRARLRLARAVCILLPHMECINQIYMIYVFVFGMYLRGPGLWLRGDLGTPLTTSHIVCMWFVVTHLCLRVLFSLQ